MIKLIKRFFGIDEPVYEYVDINMNPLIHGYIPGKFYKINENSFIYILWNIEINGMHSHYFVEHFNLLDGSYVGSSQQHHLFDLVEFDPTCYFNY